MRAYEKRVCGWSLIVHIAAASSTFTSEGCAMKTRAAVCRAFGEPLTIEEIELAPPGPGEVRVRIAACAICHSDIS
jgi:hypothetical protein